MKNIHLMLICICTCLCLSAAAQTKQIDTPIEAKPWTRWWWLGNAVDTAGIAYQLQALHKAGFGGVEITPIYGVNGFEQKEIPYLSPQWMNLLKYTIHKAQQLHMKVDMNNGTGWPFGGPQIPLSKAASKLILQTYTIHGPKTFHQKISVNNTQQQKAATLQALMAFSHSGRNIDLTSTLDSHGMLHWQVPPGEWKLIAAFNGKTFQHVKRPAPGGEGWVMDHFSQKALHTYLQRFTHAFQTAVCPVPHSFFNDSYEVFGANWTPHFFEEFKRLRGYDLKNYLPALLGIGNEDTIRRVVMDYRQTLADLLLFRFAQPWNKWVHQMGSTTRYQAHGSPGNWIDLYASADIPEIESFGSCWFNIQGTPHDSLGERPGKLDPLLLKFASSAAHVSGKKWTSSETFTWLGEHFRVSLAQCKPVLDQMWTAGINHVFFHGTPYSPPGAPWPGWQFYASVNFSPYNPIWHDIPAMNHYITRVQSLVQQGKPDNDVLLYWPIADIWAKKQPQLLFQLTIGNANQWLNSTQFYAAAQLLLQNGFSFDYISDALLQQTVVVNGQLKTPGATYQALLIPSCQFMPLSTFQHIVSLIHQGAKVIFWNKFPDDVPGLYQWQSRKKQLQSLENAIASHAGEFKNLFIGNDLTKMLHTAGILPEPMAQYGLSFIRRKNNNGYLYFVANLTHQDIAGWIPLSVSAHAVNIYDPYFHKSGAASLHQDSTTAVYMQIPSGYTYILEVYTHTHPNLHRWIYTDTSHEKIPIRGPWKLKFIQGSPSISDTFTLDSLVSWTTLNDSAKVFEGTASYSTQFFLSPNQFAQADQWMLGFHEIDFSARIFVNGHEAAILWAPPYRCDVTTYLHAGNNRLEIEVTNLAANRIADYDRKGIRWKIFKDINVVNMQYQPFDASKWGTVPSGLIGPIYLQALHIKKTY
ncbi:MAG: glycoside hydrolase [Thermoflavifilum sp.]|nr:glycoside hydrolase [Thermoflavifilum sp.]